MNTLTNSIYSSQSLSKFTLAQKLKLIIKKNKKNRKADKSKPKNFCLILGKNRTYNRQVFISRQIFRKLAKLNSFSGFIK
jgi:ribosomal protein S14